MTSPVRDVIKEIRAAGGVILRSVELFDEYQGAGMGEGQRSLAFHLRFQSDERTLKGDEVASAEASIVERLSSRLGAESRS
ncbi:MAG: phenylalanine--tRNA ligase subunit beta-related protein, partial [Candidatus Dormibacteria bacterium]